MAMGGASPLPTVTLPLVTKMKIHPGICAVACLVLSVGNSVTWAFGTGASPSCLRGRFGSSVSRASARDEAEGTAVGTGEGESVDDGARSDHAADLKRELYVLAASYDRGFGATPKARAEADDVIQKLAAINPTQNAARGIDGDAAADDGDVPLRGIWRMVWTSAFDVVSLGASPFAAPSAIYQDITNPPMAINIIDFIPRAQTLFPSSVSPPSLLRAEVTTRASSRVGAPERVGLTFEGVKLKPIELLGRRVENLPPLSVDLTWPRKTVEKLADFVPGLDSLAIGEGENNVDAPEYFDVEYLDGELLVIRQQVPGGAFALVKVDSCEP